MATYQEVGRLVLRGDTRELDSAMRKLQRRTEAQIRDIEKLGGVFRKVFLGASAGIAGTIALYRQQEQAEIQVAAAIHQVGKSAEISVDFVRQFASELQATSIYGDEAAIAATTIGLRLGNLNKDQLPRAVRLFADFGTVMGKDLPSAAAQLGRYLADPRQGMTRLAQAGIILTDATKATITSLSEQGKIVEAQNLLMGELEAKFGGASQAALEGTGIIIATANAVGDLGEAIGKELFVWLKPLIAGFKSWVEQLRKNEELVASIASAFKFAAALGGTAASLALAAVAMLKLRLAVVAVAVAFRTGRIWAAAFWGAATIGLSLMLTQLPWLMKNWDALKERIVGAPTTIRLAWQAMSLDIERAFTAMAASLVDTLASIPVLGAALPLGAVADQLAKDRVRIEGELAATRNAIAAHQAGMTAFAGVGDEGAAPVAADLALPAVDEVGGVVVAAAGTEGAGEAGVSAGQLESNRRRSEAFRKRLEERRRDLEDQRRTAREEIEILKLRNLGEEEELVEFARRKQEIDEMFREAELVRDEEHKALLLERAQQYLTLLQSDEAAYRAAKAKADEESVKTEEKADAGKWSALAGQSKKASLVLAAIDRARAIKELLITTPGAATQAYTKTAATFGWPLGPILGAVAAAAVTAQGASGLASVRSAEHGALVEGTRGFGDQYPYLLSRGEVVTPAKNYADVERGIKARLQAGDGSLADAQEVDVSIALVGQAGSLIEAATTERRQLGL